MTLPDPETGTDRSATGSIETAARYLAPVTLRPDQRAEPPPKSGIGLCLSGGGYRAMLFHVGALWRLNELGYLRRLDQVSSVSGGSIAAGVLGAAWSDLKFGAASVAQNFGELVVDPLRRLARSTLDVRAVASGLLTPGSIAGHLAHSYDRILFRGKSLHDLPEKPLFVINATNVQTGVRWRFSRPAAGDYKVGKITDPRTSLAEAVAASSAFPPVLSPIVFHFPPSGYRGGRDDDHEIDAPEYRARVILTDGGVYDNLGLQALWNECRTLLVSDGGGHIKPQEKPSRLWPIHVYRVLNIIDNQVRGLRKQQLIGSYKLELPDGSHPRYGAYWGIRSHIRDYKLDDPVAEPADKAVSALAGVKTRLKHLDDRLQERLINWGYGICDTGMRRHVEPDFARPQALPYPDSGID